MVDQQEAVMDLLYGAILSSGVPSGCRGSLVGHCLRDEAGEDPFILCQGVPLIHFSAWDYAKARCSEICGEGAPRLAPPARPAGMG